MDKDFWSGLRLVIAGLIDAAKEASFSLGFGAGGLGCALVAVNKLGISGPAAVLISMSAFFILARIGRAVDEYSWSYGYGRRKQEEWLSAESARKQKEGESVRKQREDESARIQREFEFSRRLSNIEYQLHQIHDTQMQKQIMDQAKGQPTEENDSPAKQTQGHAKITPVKGESGAV